MQEKKKKSHASVADEVRRLQRDVNKWTEASGTLEFKRGKDGLPKDLWPSYSAFGNTNGGIIVIGVNDDGSIEGLRDAENYRSEFVNILSSGKKCNVILCEEDDVGIVELDGKKVLAIRVAEADTKRKPVFLDGKITRSYIRRLEGDIRCTDVTLSRMIRDRDAVTSEFSADNIVIPYSGVEDLDPETLYQYRNSLRNNSRKNHPWVDLDDIKFLTKLGAYRKERQTGEMGLTLAGLLMFGRTETIKELHPLFRIDYFEFDGSEQKDARKRWADRITPDGTWEANLYQFYFRVLSRLTADLKRPFRMGKDLTRRDDTSAHDAVREALANAIIHADYREPGGIQICKMPSGLVLSNAGTLLISKEEVFVGGMSKCRNKVLQTMFKLIGVVEEAGSGIDTMMRGWAESFLSLPDVEEDKQKPEVTWSLPYLAMTSKRILHILQQYLGEDHYAKLTAMEKIILLIFSNNDHGQNMSNQELRIYLPSLHTTDLGRSLAKLRDYGYLQSTGRSNATRYHLTEKLLNLIRGEQSSILNAEQVSVVGANNDEEKIEENCGLHIDNKLESVNNGARKEGVSSVLNARNSSVLNAGSFSVLNAVLSLERALQLPESLCRELARFRSKSRHTRDETDSIVLKLCEKRELSIQQLSILLDRSIAVLRRDCVSPLARHGQLKYTKDKATHREQSYTTNIPPAHESARG